MRGRVAILAGLTLIVAVGAVVGGVSLATRPTPGDGAPSNHPQVPRRPVIPAPERWAEVHWTRLEEPLFDLQGAWFRGVATDGSRIVVWGEKAAVDGVGQEGRRAISIVWTSHDGLTWRRHEAKLPGGEPFRLASVTVAPSGYVALGSSGGPIDIATSGFGDEWAVLGRWPVLQNGGPIFVTADGFVTAGLLAGTPVVLGSADGSAWRPIPGPAQPGRYIIGEVSRTADGLVIAGGFGDEGNWDGLLWRWTVNGGLVDVLGRQPAFVGPDRSVVIHQAVPHAGGVYVLGAVDQPAPAQCGMRGGRMAAIGPIVADVCGRTELAWASSDWFRWQEVEGLPNPAGPDSLTAGLDGLVALVDEALPGQALGNQDALWTSRDGIEWRRLGFGVPSAHSLVALPGRVIAFGERPRDMGIAVWVGTPDS